MKPTPEVRPHICLLRLLACGRSSSRCWFYSFLYGFYRVIVFKCCDSYGAIAHASKWYNSHQVYLPFLSSFIRFLSTDYVPTVRNGRGMLTYLHRRRYGSGHESATSTDANVHVS
jgi:hypothetical protein